ncbi:MAG TPA: trypsin-like peptidase domain-containing protein [Pyrinomonadaceae bacterium]|nr:trypsin-like peptidase domain-containing protein [Pyrinomonadaceae bacterium]
MERIVLKHLSGSKANQVEEFPLNHVKELILGRDPSSTVKYDPDRDDLVGRQHAKITQDPNDPSQFIVSDMNSRNGTFVNRQRIVGTTRINPGDVVQLGPGGPEFLFDIEPRPQSSTKPTRTAGLGLPPTVQASTTPVPQTRNVGTGPQPSFQTAPVGGSVGKNTVMRMINDNVGEAKRQQGRRYILAGGAGFIVLILILGAVAGFLFLRSRKPVEELEKLKSSIATKEGEAPLTANAIQKANRDAVVKLYVSWHLISREGRQVYQRYITALPKGLNQPTLMDTRTGIPCWVEVDPVTHKLEPYLTYGEDGNQYAKSVPINGIHSGSGFVVSSDGFILTARHIAAAWKTAYVFPAESNFGVVFDAKKQNIIGIINRAPTDWVPGDSRQELRDGFEGRNDHMVVAFPGSENRIAASVVQFSPRHDVALLKISLPDSMPKVEIFDNYEGIQPGDVSIVLGYPSASPPVYHLIKSQDVFNREAKKDELPDPTLSVGNVGRVLRDDTNVRASATSASTVRQDTYSEVGDVYQLTINSTGPGNSGGPVFDDRGRVVGILFARGQKDGVMLTYAVPIRYGKELMSVSGGR